jgi:perosamine synthetase
MNALALFGGEPVRVDPYPQHTTNIDEAEEKEVLEVLRSGQLSGFSARPGDRFLGGPKVKAFEKGLAEYFKIKHALTFNSATSALHGAVAAIGIGPGDEVIVPPTTMSATASCVVMQNGIPVFSDIEEETFGLDPDSVKNSITDLTKAILAVNIFGHPAKLLELKQIAKENNLVLIEDNSQAPGGICDGQMAGTVGEIGIQSLNYHKVIQTGEGGVALTDNDRFANRLALIRNHGEVVIDHLGSPTDDDLVNILGWNYRLTEVQAAIGIPQLRKIDGLIEKRIKLANLLTEGLSEFDYLQTPIVRKNCRHVYYLYPLCYKSNLLGISRKTFVEAINAEGISLGEGYVRPIYFEPMFQRKIAFGKEGYPFKSPLYKGNVSYEPGICPVSEYLHFNEFLTTDICKFPNSEKEIYEFVAAVGKITNNVDQLKKK